MKKTTQKQLLEITKRLVYAAKELINADLETASKKASNLKKLVLLFEEQEIKNAMIDYNEMCKSELQRLNDPIPMVSFQAASVTNLPNPIEPMCCGTRLNENDKCSICGDQY